MSSGSQVAFHVAWKGISKMGVSSSSALDNMVVPAVMFFFPGVHFPVLNPNIRVSETLILGF